MVEKIPAAAEFDDAVVGGPAYDGGEDDTPVGEWPVGTIASGIAELVGVACAIREVVQTLVFVHPAGFEEAVWVVGRERAAVLSQDDYGAGFFGQLQHVVTEACHPGG